MFGPFKREEPKESRQVQRARQRKAEKLGVTADELKEHEQGSPLVSRRTLLSVFGLGAAGLAADKLLNLGVVFDKTYGNVEVVNYSSDKATAAEMIHEFSEYVAEESKKRFVIVDFHSEACPACQEMEERLLPVAGHIDQDFLILKLVVTDDQWRPTNLDPLMNYFFLGDHYPEIHIYRDRDQIGVFGGRVPSERELSNFIKESIEGWHSSLPNASLDVDDNGFDLKVA